MNIDLLNIKNEPTILNKTNKYLSIISSNGFYLLNKISENFATRIDFRLDKTIKSIIDHAFTDLCLKKFHLVVSNCELSDHEALLISTPNKTMMSNKSISEKNILDYSAIHNSLINDKTIFLSNTFEQFCNNLKNLIENNKKLLKCSNSKTKCWMNNQIINALKQKSIFHINHKKYPKNKYMLEKYICLRNKVSNMIKFSKQKYYNALFEASLNNSQKYWIIIKEIVFNKTQNENNIVLERYNQLITNPEKIVNIFNDYFTNICDANGYQCNQQLDIMEYQPNS